jgi:hypothetical protein
MMKFNFVLCCLFLVVVAQAQIQQKPIDLRMDFDHSLLTSPPNEVSVLIQVKTEKGDGVENVGLSIEGSVNGMPIPVPPLFTDANGNALFTFDSTGGPQFTVALGLELNPTNGVNVYDAYLMISHILGLMSLGVNPNPKQIAADINRSGTITTFDIVQLRNVVLGKAPTFPSNKSWRFVDTIDIWTPFILEEGKIAPPYKDLTFTGIKIGDVDQSVLANSLMVEPPRDSICFLFNNGQVLAGEEVTIIFTSNQPIDMAQGTFRFKNLEVLELNSSIGSEAFGLFEETSSSDITDIVTFFLTEFLDPSICTVKVKALKSGTLKDMIRISNDYTPSMAFLKDSIKYSICSDFVSNSAETVQNTMQPRIVPNPWNNATQIQFNLPQSDQVTLQVFDIQGRTLYSSIQDFASGAQVIALTREQVAAEGILMYRLSTSTGIWTGKMEVIR